MKKQYYPQVQVELFGFVSKTGYRDITSWFGDQCTIRVSKGIFEPAGSFSITFLDRPVDKDSSVYAKIAPMDGVRISVAHDGTQPLKTILRGFVCDVRREEGMGEDGRPVRRVVISGQDAGVIWTTQYVYFMPIAKDAADLLTGYGVFAKYLHTMPKPVPGAEFVGTMASILHDHLKTLTAGSRMEMSIAPAAQGEGAVPAALIQYFRNIPIHQFMSSLLDAGAFYELWLDDPGEGPVSLRWRPLWSGPGGETITEDEISAISVFRNHSRVHNWFWAYPRGGALVNHTQAFIEGMRAGGIPDARKLEPSHEQYFGFRQLRVDMSLVPDGWAANADATTRQQNKSGEAAMTAWIQNRTALLKDLNLNNAHLESCTMRVRGNEKIRPGTWLMVLKESEGFLYYATRVEHEIVLWQGYTTTVHGERGERRSGDGTYRSELDLKGAQK